MPTRASKATLARAAIVTLALVLTGGLIAQPAGAATPSNHASAAPGSTAYVYARAHVSITGTAWKTVHLKCTSGTKVAGDPHKVSGSRWIDKVGPLYVTNGGTSEHFTAFNYSLRHHRATYEDTCV